MLTTELSYEIIDTLNDIHIEFDEELAVTVQEKVLLGLVEPSPEILWQEAYTLADKN